MHPRSKATLEQLDRSTWFCNVGVQDTQNAIVLTSWDHAIKHVKDLDWRNLRLKAANRLSAKLLKSSIERFNNWNDLVHDLKSTTIPFVKQKIEAVIRENRLPEAFEDAVQWDILHVCMESEYADMVPPGFYAGHTYWYTMGHFPCGWQANADLPHGGKPLVY